MEARIYDYPDENYESAYSMTRPSGTSTKNLFLMARNNNGTADGFTPGSRCYEFQVWNESSQQIMHLLPVREKTGVDPKVGMYDVVNDTVFWSATEANFLAGPDLSNAEVSVKVNGSWETGTPYIKVNGSWEEATDVYIKVNGNWESAV